MYLYVHANIQYVGIQKGTRVGLQGTAYAHMSTVFVLCICFFLVRHDHVQIVKTKVNNLQLFVHIKYVWYMYTYEARN